jgi:hypothetical protein
MPPVVLDVEMAVRGERQHDPGQPLLERVALVPEFVGIGDADPGHRAHREDQPDPPTESPRP